MAPWAMYGEVQVIAWSSLRHVGPQTLEMGSRNLQFGGPKPQIRGARSCLGPIRDSIVHHVRDGGTPEIPRSPSYLGGPSAGPIALAGRAVLLILSRTWPGPDLDPQNGHFWGPKWSILAIFGIKLGPKLVILGSKMAHFGGPNSSKEPRNTHLVAVYPPNMPIWAIWALLAIWVGNGVFYPFLDHFDQMGRNMTVRRSTGHGPN